MTSPNINATPESIANEIDGIDANAIALSFRQAALLYNARMFGLSIDYAFPEGSNVTPSAVNHITTLAKLLSRKQTLADKNDYDLWDAVFTIAKWVVKNNPTINDDEVNSVNYKAPSA